MLSQSHVLSNECFCALSLAAVGNAQAEGGIALNEAVQMDSKESEVQTDSKESEVQTDSNKAEVQAKVRIDLNEAGV